MEDDKRFNWAIWFMPRDRALVDKIETARRAKGMTKKGFVLYAIANMIPELAPDIVDHLMAKPYSKNVKAVSQDIEKVANE